MIIVDTIIQAVEKVVDKIVPDANMREQVKMQLRAEALEWYKLDAADRDSARKREVETKDTTTRELAWIYTIGYFGMLAALLSGYVVVPAAQDSLLDVLMGVLTAGQYSIMAYYFGSSSGSAIKDTVIGTIAKNGYH